MDRPCFLYRTREDIVVQFSEEVTEAVHDCCGNKALGLDSMTVAFLWAN